MEQYGEFSEIINRLQSNLSEVRCVWTDQTAQTYDHINENIEAFVTKLWMYYSDSRDRYNAVKANYNEFDFDDELNMLNSKINSV